MNTPTPVPPAPEAPQTRRHSAFVPMLLLVLSALAFFVANIVEGYRARTALQAAHAGQQQTVDNAAKLRQSLDALAADTQRLANGGNPNAALLVDELRKRGVTITVPPAPAPSAPR